VTTPDGLPSQVLDWSGRLMAARSLADFGELLERPPGADAGGLSGALLLLDPRQELRRLATGTAPTPLTGLRFVASLAGVAPGYDTLHAPWCGAYRAADHGLLFAPESGCQHLLLLPLPRRDGLTGVYNIAGHDRAAALFAAEPAWRDHIAAQVSATAERLLNRAWLLHAGVVDPLTGWNSRHYFLARLREQLAVIERHPQPASCLVVDVDGLAALNERHGVATGDLVLAELGILLESQVRACDSLAHLGEDEFAVLLPGADAAGADRVAGRILEAVRGAAPAGGARLQVSIGVAVLEPASSRSVGQSGRERKAEVDGWLARAQAALHLAKRDGGNRHVAG
jgi:diguanylate cyclase (GGDEF)-like protein